MAAAPGTSDHRGATGLATTCAESSASRDERHHRSTLARRPHRSSRCWSNSRPLPLRREDPRRRAARALGVAVRTHGAAHARRRRAPSAPTLRVPRNRRHGELLGARRVSSSTPRSCSTCTARVPRRAQAASRACCSRSRRSRRARTCTTSSTASSSGRSDPRRRS